MFAKSYRSNVTFVFHDCGGFNAVPDSHGVQPCWPRYGHFYPAMLFKPVEAELPRLNCIHFLSPQVPCDEVERWPLTLPAWGNNPDYNRQPLPQEMFVPKDC